jgi:hypothetical protein
MRTVRTLLVTLVCVSSGLTVAGASPGVVAGTTAGGPVAVALPTPDGTDPRLRCED